MDIVTIESNDLDYLKSLIKNATSVRVCQENDGIKISVNQGIWTLPMGNSTP